MFYFYVIHCAAPVYSIVAESSLSGDITFFRQQAYAVTANG